MKVHGRPSRLHLLRHLGKSCNDRRPARVQRDVTAQSEAAGLHCRGAAWRAGGDAGRTPRRGAGHAAGARGRGGEGRPGQAAVGDSTLGQTWPRPAWAARVAADSAVRGSLSQDTAREGRTERLAQEDSAALQGLLQQRAGSGGGVGGVQREGDHAARRGGASNTRRVCATLSRTRAVQRLRRIALSSDRRNGRSRLPRRALATVRSESLPQGQLTQHGGAARVRGFGVKEGRLREQWGRGVLGQPCWKTGL